MNRIALRSGYCSWSVFETVTINTSVHRHVDVSYTRHYIARPSYDLHIWSWTVNVPGATQQASHASRWRCTHFNKRVICMYTLRASRSWLRLRSWLQRWRHYMATPSGPQLYLTRTAGLTEWLNWLMISTPNLHDAWRMEYSGMLRRVALVRTDVPDELSASIIRVTRIDELGTLAVTSNRRKLRRNTKWHIQGLCISSQRASIASYG
jgi:hypothetical protein